MPSLLAADTASRLPLSSATTGVPTRQASDRLVRWPGAAPACVPVILTVSTPTPDRIAPARPHHAGRLTEMIEEP